MKEENEKRLEDRIVDGSLIQEIVPILLNPEKEEMWKDRPHLAWNGLIVAFDVPLIREGREVDLIVSHQMLDIWNLNKEELLQQAVNNQSFLDAIIVQTLDENLKQEHGIVSGFSKPDKEHEMYIISTKGQYYGAGAVLCTDTMASLAKQTGGDLYLLPSSVHEFMAASCEGYTAVEMKSWLYELNLMSDTNDQLSNHLFLYDREKREIGLAVQKIKERKADEKRK